MKVALLSESPADEAVLRVLVEAVLGAAPTFVSPGLRARGWPNVGQILPAVIRHLHFNTDTDALVVSCDSDDSVVHTEVHDAPGYFHPHCRMCQLRGIFHRTTKKLPEAHGRARVLRGVGIAVPALEAWLLCGREAGVTEAAWLEGQKKNRPPYARWELKQRVYGTDRPSLPHEISCAMRELERIGRDPRRLENDFPGFAYLASDMRNWGKINS